MGDGGDHEAGIGECECGVVMPFERAAGAMRHDDQRQIAPRDRPALGDCLLEESKPLRRGEGFARIPNADFEGRASGIGHHDLFEPGR